MMYLEEKYHTKTPKSETGLLMRVVAYPSIVDFGEVKRWLEFD